MSSADNILPLKPGLKQSDELQESREDKLLRLQRLIDDEKYEIDSEAVSEALLESEVAKNRKNSKK